MPIRQFCAISLQLFHLPVSRILSFLILFLLALQPQLAQSQTYILNEDFSSASGTTPPVDWRNTTITGQLTDEWHFDNPGGRSINYPITGKFAIFDSENYSAAGGAENVVLESKFFDASISNNTVLYFDHFFAGGRNGQGIVEVFNGFTWNILTVFNDSTANPQSEVFNISALVGGVTNAKVRFRWQGDNSMYWALDNIRIYAPLTLDAGVTAVVSPTMPFNAGTQPINVRLTNFGAANLTNTTIGWSVNNVVQPSYNWSGFLLLGASDNNVTIGSYNFPTGKPVRMKVWQKNPNGGSDGNASNDTIFSTLYSSLCGIYTIGGVNPDFATFTEAATALNNAGITCPVTFRVRDGIYNEQVKIGQVTGASAVNTITFESESGTNTLAQLFYQVSNPSNDNTLILDGSSYITFRKLSIKRSNGLGTILIRSGAHDIHFIDNIISGALSAQGTTSQPVDRVEVKSNTITGSSYDNYPVYFLYATNSYISDYTIVGYNERYTVHINSCSGTRILSNAITNQYIYNYAETGVHLVSSTNTLLGNNTIRANFRGIESNQSMNTRILNNDITTYSSGTIRLNAGIRVSNNSLVTADSLEVYSNTIKKVMSGIVLPAYTNIGTWVRSNDLSDIDGGSAIEITQGKGEVTLNHISGITNGNGIKLSASNFLTANNFIQAQGTGIAKGIINSGSNNRIVFNSVNITGSDPVNGRAFENNGGSNLTIKNNIFANTGAGYAAYITTAL